LLAPCRPATRRPQPHRGRLGLENLETRLVPTGVQYLGGVLTVTGDQAQANQADTVTVDLNPTAPQVTLNGQTTTLAAGSALTAVHLDLGGGSDTMNVANSSAAEGDP